MSELAPVVYEGSTDWMRQGECLYEDTEIFFPLYNVEIEKAKRFCDKCVVQPECLEFALKNKIDDGIWGGASERDRRRISRRRRLGR